MKLKVSAIQMGPFSGTYQNNMQVGLEMFEKAGSERPDLVVFSEMMTVPYFGGVRDPIYFGMAEPADGPFITAMAKKAAELRCNAIVTWFEKETTPSGKIHYFNSAGLITPESGLVGVYRKVHLPRVETADLITDEPFYFERGDDFPVFEVMGVKIGILICYDRSFPEAWRTLWLKGAEVVLVPVATYGFRQKIFMRELEVRAAENHIFVVAANKAGEESVKNEKLIRNHFGSSCVIDPYGNVINQLDSTPFSILTATLDLSLVAEANGVLDWRRDRRPELYAELTK